MTELIATMALFCCLLFHKSQRLVVCSLLVPSFEIRTVGRRAYRKNVRNPMVVTRYALRHMLGEFHHHGDVKL
jgi:hypothetical protein